MPNINIGRSSFGNLRGVMQVLDAEAGRQFIGMLAEVNRTLGYTTPTTPRLTPNEGFRSAARCKAFLNAWLLYLQGRGPVAALAASPWYSSRHYNGGRGRASDIGVTMPDGSNRAMNSHELATLHSIEIAWGFHPTGLNFAKIEIWHHDYLGGATKIAPVTISLASAAKPVELPKPTTPLLPEGDDAMFLATAVGDTDPRLGNIKGRLFKISPVPFISSKDGKLKNGSVVWVKVKSEADALKAVYKPVGQPSNRIWQLVNESNYERQGW